MMSWIVLSSSVMAKPACFFLDYSGIRSWTWAEANVSMLTLFSPSQYSVSRFADEHWRVRLLTRQGTWICTHFDPILLADFEIFFQASTLTLWLSVSQTVPPWMLLAWLTTVVKKKTVIQISQRPRWHLLMWHFLESQPTKIPYLLWFTRQEGCKFSHERMELKTVWCFCFFRLKTLLVHFLPNSIRQQECEECVLEGEGVFL